MPKKVTVVRDKSGNRFVTHGKKRYRIESKDSTHLILQDIDKILKTILERERRSKKRRKITSKSSSNAPQPKSSGRSLEETKLRDEQFKTFNLQRQLDKKRLSQPPPAPPPSPASLAIKDNPLASETIDVTLESHIQHPIGFV